MYFGPHNPIGSSNNQNLIDDFGFLALGIRQNAEQGFDTLSEESQALLTGYAAGYNQYLSETGVNNIDPTCAGQPFVQEITPVDLLTYAQGVALLRVRATLLGLFCGAPVKTVQLSLQIGKRRLDLFTLKCRSKPQLKWINGWAIRSELSAPVTAWWRTRTFHILAISGFGGTEILVSRV